ncbi:hypothetical protein [Photobacterium alginatilyticum]|uniref:Uncharacterized protein n=1 Tax=Photobacterium alginatilyticum TaxID=1775171 RepID=A0ABW9YLE5_9GAMM|nr:hypothetical protein [Photobacterium alginatilyticum]NBI54672.1 hypothetical protein [Photobacterium alginatilyticum]
MNTQQEFDQAVAGLKTQKRLTLSADTQFNRVVSSALGLEWSTLRDLEQQIQSKFDCFDTQTAISARLREVKPSNTGLVKQRMCKSVNSKLVHYYRLVPASMVPTLEEAA